MVRFLARLLGLVIGVSPAGGIASATDGSARVP